MKTEQEIKDEVYEVHKQVVKLCHELDSVLYKYLTTQQELLTHNEKFIVVSRAINTHARHWCNHFHTEFDPEKFLERARQTVKHREEE